MLLLRASALSSLYKELSPQVSVWLVSSCGPHHDLNAAFHCSSLQQSPKCLPSMSFTDLYIYYLFIYPLLIPTEVLENQIVLALWLTVAKGT